MASQFKFAIDIRDDGLLIVTEEQSAFLAMYEKRTDRPELVLVRRAPTADHELVGCCLSGRGTERARAGVDCVVRL